MARNAHKSTFVRGSLPNIFEGEDRRFQQCEQPFIVLASVEDGSMYKNDVTHVFQNVVLSSDTVSITIEKNGVELTNRGTSVFYPNSPNAVGFIFDWRQYLQNEGAGCYTIKLSCVLAGVQVDFTWGNYELSPWTIDSAMNTVRVYSRFNSYALNHNIDFTGSNAVDSIRFEGFFGNMQPNTKVNNLRGNNNVQSKVTRENLKTYELTSDLLNVCHTKRLIDLHFLHENTVWISDHNPQNHSYDYRDVELIVKEVPEVDYKKDVRGAVVSCVFEDKQPYYKSRYRTSSPLGDVTPAPTCPDTTLQVNGVTEGTHVAGSTIGINLSDGVNPVNPDSVTKVGDNYEVVVPAPTTGWKRNPDWLPLPDISATPNKMVCLFLVYENGGNDVRLNCSTNAYQVDWGDGSPLETIGTVEHVYDYSSLSGDVNVDEYGRNYKQVIIQVDELIVNTNFEFRPSVSGIVGYACADIYSTMQSFVRFVNSYAPNLEIFEQHNITQALNFNSFYTSKLPYVKRLVLNPLTSIQNAASFSALGEVDFFQYSDTSNTWNNCFLRSRVKKLHLISSGCINAISVINECALLEECIIDFPLVENITSIASSCSRLRSLVFTSVANVITTTNAFLNCTSLEELILQNITVGFSCANGRMTAQALNDLFTSLGTANGWTVGDPPTQTIIVTGNPGVATCDTTIATAKGFIVTI